MQNWSQEHADDIREIYQHGIDTGNATFETTVPDWQEILNKYLEAGRVAVVEDNRLLGWAALTPVSNRACYSGVAEVTVYVHKNFQGRGIGKQLLKALIIESERAGIWSLLSVIHEENRASIHLHEQCGFRFIGYREKIAKLNGIWRTTVMMEKRSPLII